MRLDAVPSSGRTLPTPSRRAPGVELLGTWWGFLGHPGARLTTAGDLEVESFEQRSAGVRLWVEHLARIAHHREIGDHALDSKDRTVPLERTDECRATPEVDRRGAVERRPRMAAWNFERDALAAEPQF